MKDPWRSRGLSSHTFGSRIPCATFRPIASIVNETMLCCLSDATMGDWRPPLPGRAGPTARLAARLATAFASVLATPATPSPSSPSSGGEHDQAACRARPPEGHPLAARAPHRQAIADTKQGPRGRGGYGNFHRFSIGDHVTPTLLPAGAIEALALCDAPLPVRLSLPPCSSHARGEPVATVRALPACAARCFCRHAADSAHSPWPEPCTFLRLCVALLRSEGMHRRLQDPVSMRDEGVHRTF